MKLLSQKKLAENRNDGFDIAHEKARKTNMEKRPITIRGYKNNAKNFKK